MRRKQLSNKNTNLSAQSCYENENDFLPIAGWKTLIIDEQ